MGYYTRAHEAIHSVHIARRTLRCQGDAVSAAACHDTIQPGEHYTLSKLPPNSDLGNVEWWTVRLCSGCMEIPAAELREVTMRPDGRPYVRRRQATPRTGGHGG